MHHKSSKIALTIKVLLLEIQLIDPPLLPQLRIFTQSVCLGGCLSRVSLLERLDLVGFPLLLGLILLELLSVVHFISTCYNTD